VLAYHYARSDARDKALQYLELAGDRAAVQSATRAAEHHYQALLDRLGSVGRGQDVARVRDKLGEVFCRTGKFDAALPLLEAAADSFRAAGDWESLVRVAARIGWAHSRRGTPRDGIARMTLLLQCLDHNGASPPRGPLYEALGQALYIAGDYQESLAACERAADLARAAGDDRTRVLAQWHRVNLLMILGRLTEALQVGQEALPLAEALGDPLCLTRAHRILAEAYALCGALETGRKHLAQAHAAAEQLGDAGQQSIALSMCGWLALLRGDGRDARATLDRALELSRQVDGVVYTTYPLFCLARLSLVEGDWATTATVGREAVALAERGGDLQGLRWSSGVMAELEILEGRPEAAAARLRPLLDRPGLEECDVTTLLPVLAWAQLAQGQTAQVTATVEQALARTRRDDVRLVLVEALRVAALIALRQEHWAEARRSLEEGVGLTRAMPYPYAEARLLHVYGEMHAQKGEPEVARERLEAALATFRRLGARRDAVQVDQALATVLQNPPCANRSAPSFATRVTDAQWTAIAALLAPGARPGRPRADDRRTLEAILYKLDTGCGWHAIPSALGDGVTAYRRLRAWQAAGVWERIDALLAAAPGAMVAPDRPAGTRAQAPDEARPLRSAAPLHA
jgi:tetratricopeptide (TPR) repeat protein